MLLDDVTSNLASRIKKADHGQGGGGTRNDRRKGRKSFVLKILTCKLFAVKILQALFANPAPSKSFRGRGEGGIPQNPELPEMEHDQHAVKNCSLQHYLREICTSLLLTVQKPAE